MTKPTFKEELRYQEAEVIRKKRPFSKTQWVAMGTDAKGLWVETFYSSTNKFEAQRCVEVLTATRLRCHVSVLERA